MQKKSTFIKGAYQLVDYSAPQSWSDRRYITCAIYESQLRQINQMLAIRDGLAQTLL